MTQQQQASDPPALSSSPPPPPPSSSFTPPDPSSAEPYLRAMESLMRIALAGFGGALAGLSVSRRRGTFGAATTATAARTGRSKASASRPYVDHDLPSTWAVACLTFAGIIEFTRLVGPTSVLIDSGRTALSGVSGGGEGSASEEEERNGITGERSESAAVAAAGAPSSLPSPRPPFWNTSEAHTVGDYVMGGSVAGAVFKGSTVRTRAGERLAASARTTRANPAPIRGAARTGIVAGLLPGAALGLFAGLAQVGVDRLQTVAQRRLEAGEEEGGEMIEERTKGEEATEDGGVEADGLKEEVKKLTLDELQRQIEELRGSPAAGR